MTHQSISELPNRPVLDFGSPAQHTPGMESVEEPPTVGKEEGATGSHPFTSWRCRRWNGGMIPAWTLSHKYLERCMEIKTNQMRKASTIYSELVVQQESQPPITCILSETQGR